MVWDCFKTEKIRPWGLCCIFTVIPMPCNSISFPSTPQNQEYYWNVWSWILPFIFPPIHILNHIIVFCWKVSIVTHARCLAAHWLRSEWPWTRGILVGSEWAWTSHPTKTAGVCFLSRKTYCDISPGDNMRIYGAAVNANYKPTPTHPPKTHTYTHARTHHTHTHTLAFNGIHQSPCYQQISPGPQVYKGGCAHCRPTPDRVTNDAIYYHT